VTLTGKNKDDGQRGVMLVIWHAFLLTLYKPEKLSNKVFSVYTIFIKIAIKGLRHIERNMLVTIDNVISPNNTCDLNKKKQGCYALAEILVPQDVSLHYLG